MGFGVKIWLFGFLVLGLPLAWAETPTSEWDSTAVRFRSFEKYVLPQCHKSVLISLGCLEALNTLAARLKDPTILLFEGMESAYPDRLGPLFEQHPKQHQLVREYSLRIRIRPTSYQERALAIGSRLDLFESHLLRLRNSGAYFPFQYFFKNLSFRFLKSKTKRVSEAAVASEMINAFLATAFDPHTHLIAAGKAESTNDSDDSKKNVIPTVGIGVLLEKFPFGWGITHVDRLGPAAQAGVRPGDVLLRVDGELTKRMNLWTLAEKISGHPCAAHRLTLLRNGKRLDLSVTHFLYTPSTVEFQVLRSGGRIGHIKIRTFNEARLPRNADDFLRAIDPFVDSWVLDLRGNGGGNLQDGISVASMFLGRKEIVRIVSDEGVVQRKYGKFEAVSRKPLVVLIDNESASASELVAQSLEDHKRAWIVGDRSYGKGTGQRVISLPGDVQLATTAFTFFGPRKITPQVRGVFTDFSVPHRPDQPLADLNVLREESYYARPREIQGAQWSHARPKDLEWMKVCVDKTGSAKKLFEDSIKKSRVPDYRMFVAIDVVRCQYWLQDAKRL